MIIKNNKTMPRVIFGFIVGIITMVIAASVGNYFIFLPLYKVPLEARLDMILPILMPFNAIKGIIVAFVSVLLHQSMKNIYRYIK
jgi:riboflavin transporter FmnP